MSIYFSASTGGFYDDTIHHALPDDAQSISADLHHELLDGQSNGLIIASDRAGKPVLQSPPPPTAEQMLSQLRTQRDLLLRESDWTQMTDSPLSASGRELWAAYRQALRDLPETVADLTAIDWPTAPTI